jgi:hypothetical protein
VTGCIRTYLVRIAGVRVIILNEAFEWLAVLIRIPEISCSIFGIKASFPDYHTFSFLSNLAFIFTLSPLSTLNKFCGSHSFVELRDLGFHCTNHVKLTQLVICDLLRLIYVGNGVFLYIIWFYT